jgi:hypothetical protein
MHYCIRQRISFEIKINKLCSLCSFCLVFTLVGVHMFDALITNKKALIIIS